MVQGLHTNEYKQLNEICKGLLRLYQAGNAIIVTYCAQMKLVSHVTECSTLRGASIQMEGQ